MFKLEAQAFIWKLVIYHTVFFLFVCFYRVYRVKTHVAQTFHCLVGFFLTLQGDLEQGSMPNSSFRGGCIPKHPKKEKKEWRFLMKSCWSPVWRKIIENISILWGFWDCLFATLFHLPPLIRRIFWGKQIYLAFRPNLFRGKEHLDGRGSQKGS